MIIIYLQLTHEPDQETTDFLETPNLLTQQRHHFSFIQNITKAIQEQWLQTNRTHHTLFYFHGYKVAKKLHSTSSSSQKSTRRSFVSMENFCQDHQYGKFHFVLIHGAGHGAWCWYKLIHLLRNSGHKVTAMDLTGSGLNSVDPDSVTSFEDYDMPLMSILSEIPYSQKVVLVGHSAGGLSLSHAIHVFGHKIAVAVYIAATMLSHGLCTDQDIQQGVPDLLKVSEFYHGLGSEQPPTSAMIHRELQQEILYQLSPPEDAALASLLIRPTPLLALQTAKFIATSEQFMKVPRVYIKTLQDKIVSLDKQEAMIKMWPPDKVISMDTDHSPFFSSPLELHRNLLYIAQLFAG